MFQGFSQETITFLNDLRDNNNKTWFEANRERYQRVLLQPMRELVKSLAPFMLSIDPLLEIIPKRTISRINRDVRFSRDKSPYRANMWLAFKRVCPDWKAEPTYYFEIFPDSYRYGMGFYNITKETLAELRRLIDERDSTFQKVHCFYNSQDLFTLKGEKYKRIINPDLPPDLNEWYQRKELYFACNRPLEERLFSPRLVEELMDGFGKLAPVYNFFIDLRKL